MRNCSHVKYMQEVVYDEKSIVEKCNDRKTRFKLFIDSFIEKTIYRILGKLLWYSIDSNDIFVANFTSIMT